MISKISTVFMILLIICGLYWIIGVVIEDERQLKECFFQSPKTPECEYRLWKYENRDKSSDYIVINGR